MRHFLAFVVAVSVVTLGMPPAQAADPPAPTRMMDERLAVAYVLELLDQRLAIMPDVAAYKWSRQAPIQDPPREQAVIQNAVDRAAPLGLDAVGVRRVFDLQIRLARDVQSELHARWKKSGFDKSRSIPSLENDIRPKLDRITPELLRALYLTAYELQRDDFVAVYTVLASERLTAQGWSESSRRETLEALHAVRLKAMPTLDRIRASGVLRIGTTGDYAPFSLLTGDTLSGSDIELAKSLAQKLQARPVFVRTTWGRLVDDLNVYKFDIAIGGVSVTPARQAVAAFSVPYTSGGKTIVSRCKDARRYRSLKAVDRREVRVIVNPGGTNEQFAREKLPHANVRVFPDNRTIFEEIRAGRADVMITDDVEVELQTHRHKDLCRPFSGTFTHSDKAILMPREHTGGEERSAENNLRAVVNNWLESEVQIGNPERLIEQFLQSPP